MPEGAHLAEPAARVEADRMSLPVPRNSMSSAGPWQVGEKGRRGSGSRVFAAILTAGVAP